MDGWTVAGWGEERNMFICSLIMSVSFSGIDWEVVTQFHLHHFGRESRRVGIGVGNRYMIG